jgi:hypothetical protein
MHGRPKNPSLLRRCQSERHSLLDTDRRRYQPCRWEVAACCPSPLNRAARPSVNPARSPSDQVSRSVIPHSGYEHGAKIGHAAFLRRRGHAGRPLQTNTRPGRPAPATGPGTAVTEVCLRPFLAAWRMWRMRQCANGAPNAIYRRPSACISLGAHERHEGAANVHQRCIWPECGTGGIILRGSYVEPSSWST